MEMTDQNTILLSNRSGKDRRIKSGFNIHSFLFGGKRAKIRRQVDTNRIFYVDQFSTELFVVIVSIIILCICDAFLTLRLLSRGAYEVNPVMKYFLEIGPYTFFFFKYFLTIASAICLLMFRNVVIRVIKVKTRSVLYFVLLFYAAVVAWETYLISDLSDRPDLKLKPKVFIDSQIICQIDIFNPYPISKGKILI
jgi:hypothetical protein